MHCPLDLNSIFSLLPDQTPIKLGSVVESAAEEIVCCCDGDGIVFAVTGCGFPMFLEKVIGVSRSPPESLRELFCKAYVYTMVSLSCEIESLLPCVVNLISSPSNSPDPFSCRMSVI